MTQITRRELAMLATAALIARTALAQTNEAPSIIRAIPPTGSTVTTSKPGVPRRWSSGRSSNLVANSSIRRLPMATPRVCSAA